MNQELLIMIIALACAGGTVIAILLYLIHSKRRDLQEQFDRAALDGIKYPAYTLRQVREPGHYWYWNYDDPGLKTVHIQVDFDPCGALVVNGDFLQDVTYLRDATLWGPIPVPRKIPRQSAPHARWPKPVPSFIHRYPAKA